MVPISLVIIIIIIIIVVIIIIIIIQALHYQELNICLYTHYDCSCLLYKAVAACCIRL
jgi:hypothetical protein